MIIDCIFLYPWFSFISLDMDNVWMLANLLFLEIIFTIGAFGVNSILWSATNQNNLVVFIKLMFFLNIWSLSDTHMHCDNKMWLSIIKKDLVKIFKKEHILIDLFFQSEFIVFYKHHQTIFNIIFSLYELTISDWSTNWHFLHYRVRLFVEDVVNTWTAYNINKCRTLK